MRTKRQPTEEQRARAAERREQFKALCQRVAAMSEDQRAELATRYGIFNPEGHSLSPYNCCLLISQAATFMPSIVAGFQQWRRARRMVRKGETGLMIWVPIGKAKDKAAEQSADSSATENERPGFIMGYVFDISQTEPIESE